MTHHHTAESSLPRLAVGFMRPGSEPTTDSGDVFGVDEVKAGINSKPAGEPEPATDLSKPFREVTGWEVAGAIHPSAEYQRREDSNDLGRQRMLLQILKTARLGLDVFGALGQSFRQWAKVPIQNAGR